MAVGTKSPPFTLPDTHGDESDRIGFVRFQSRITELAGGNKLANQTEGV